MPNYQNGVVYKLCCNDLSIKDIYIGSTTSFRKRKYTHKSQCNNIKSKNYNSKVYKFIRANCGFKNWSMILIAETPCNSKLELNKHERYYYEKFNSTLNSLYPGRTRSEYYEDNKDKIIIKVKNYRKKNNIKVKKYREANKYKVSCEFCNKMISKLNIPRHRKGKKCLLIQNKIKLSTNT